MKTDLRSKVVEYMCSCCGARQTKSKLSGKPAPGKCPHKKNGGPHTWRYNRDIN